MEIIAEIFPAATVRIAVIAVLLIGALALVVFFIQYNIDRAKGRHAKFLWFETKPVQQAASDNINVPQANLEFHNSKNVNTGNNWGNIGDTYSGISQRHVDGDEMSALVNQIETFRAEHKDKIKHTHVTIGRPGDKESMIFANEIALALVARGYSVIPTTLMTFGVFGKRFDVSTAPDDSVLVAVYPADNVSAP